MNKIVKIIADEIFQVPMGVGLLVPTEVFKTTEVFKILAKLDLNKYVNMH